jgi:N-acetylmuramoyl-L-alanine amidase
MENVKILPEGTPVPHSYFTSCSISGDDKYDQVSFSLNDSVVYAISSQSFDGNYLVLDFFNTHLASTWNSHKTGAQIIGNVKGEQMDEDWVRFTIPVHCKQIWGYWIEKDDNRLTLNIKSPPKIAGGNDSPVKDLLFAVEAGHGKSNSGAVGTMGTKEKTINYNAVKAVQKILEEKGAKTVLVRPGDSNPYLPERVKSAIEAGADFFLSIHANSAGSSRGYLSVSGTSTYYKDDHCYLPAKKVYDELLKLDWGEFGVVGNFHYSPLRSTNMPSILVEQAFMSNPYDEARLLDPDYQKEQAEAIVKGLEDFLNEVRE